MEPAVDDDSYANAVADFLIHVADHIEKDYPELAHDCRNYAMTMRLQAEIRKLLKPTRGTQ